MEKYIKNFKGFINEMKVDGDLIDMFSNFDKFRHDLITHTDYKSNVLVAVYVVEKFEEVEGGRYEKNYEPLTNIMKITPDKSSFTNVNMMKVRGRIQDASGLMILQWVDKGIVDDMVDAIRNDWQSEDGQFYLKTIVNHYKEHSLNNK